MIPHEIEQKRFAISLSHLLTLWVVIKKQLHPLWRLFEYAAGNWKDVSFVRL